MAVSSVTVRGFAEYQAALRKLGKAFDADGLRPVLLRGAESLRDPVRTEAAFFSDTGRLRESIVAKLHANPQIATAYMAVDFSRITKKDKRGKPVRYPYIVEYGSRPHIIPGRLRINGRIVQGGVQHPGFRARGYFREGVRRGRPYTRRLLEDLLTKEARRLENLNVPAS